MKQPSRPKWMCLSEGNQREIQKKILSFLLNYEGYLRKKIPLPSRIQIGRIIDGPIWSELSLRVSPSGLYGLALTMAPPPSEAPPENSWDLGDQILFYLVWKHFRENGVQPPSFLQESPLVQLLGYPYFASMSSRESWKAFLHQGGYIFLIYGEKKISRLWARYTLDFLYGPPPGRGWILSRTCQCFEALLEIFWEEDFPHLLGLFLSYFRELFPTPEKKKNFLTFFPWPEGVSSDQHWEMEKNLENLLSLPSRIHRIWQEITSKHHLDQSTSEMLFLEKYP